MALKVIILVAAAVLGYLVQYLLASLLPAQLSSNKHRLFLAMVIFVIAFFIVNSENKDPTQVTPASQTSITGTTQTPGLNNPQFSPTKAEITVVLLPTQTQPVTEHSSSPEQFVRDYLGTLNNRQYDLAYSMMSDNFQASQSYDEYVSYWDTVEKVEILLVSIKSQKTSQVLVYVEARYYYKADYVANGHTTYKLIKNGNSWLFDPN